jgi:hypothetical protein
VQMIYKVKLYVHRSLKVTLLMLVYLLLGTKRKQCISIKCPYQHQSPITFQIFRTFLNICMKHYGTFFDCDTVG